MIKKTIGLILVLIIFFFAIKAVSLFPLFTDLVIGNNQSPFQVGTTYMDQINKTYPYNNYGQVNTWPVKYGQDNTLLSKITLEKINGKLVLSIENAKPTRNDLNIWLTNNPELTNKTEYIDFGPLYKNNSIQQYVIDMKGGDISFDEYKNILIVDKNNKVYNKIILK